MGRGGREKGSEQREEKEREKEREYECILSATGLLPNTLNMLRVVWAKAGR